LIPAQNIKHVFDIWGKAASIDLGESFAIPDDN
jgi:hypothetical protein